MASQGKVGCGAEGASGAQEPAHPTAHGLEEKYTELQAHAKQSPLIFMKRAGGMGGKFV